MTDGVRLSARDLVGYALRQMARNFGVLVGLCAPALLILVGAAVLGRVMFPGQPIEDAPPGSGGAGGAEEAPAGADAAIAAMDAGVEGALTVLMLASLAATVALVPAFTGWHRLLITGDARRADGRAYGWDRREWRYLSVLAGIWLAMFVINLALRLVLGAFGGEAAAAVGAALALIAYLGLWASVGLALPAAALGDQRRLPDILNLAQGNVRRIAVAIAAVWIALTAVGLLAGLVVGFASAALASIYLVFVFGMLFYYVGLVASVGVFSRAYALLTRQAAGPPPTAAV